MYLPTCKNVSYFYNNGKGWHCQDDEAIAETGFKQLCILVGFIYVTIKHAGNWWYSSSVEHSKEHKRVFSFYWA